MSKTSPLATILNLNAKQPRRTSRPPIEEVPNKCLSFVERRNSAQINYKHFPYLMYSESKPCERTKPTHVKNKPKKKKARTGSKPKLVLHPSKKPKERYKTIEDALLVTNPPLMGVRAISFMYENKSRERETPVRNRRPGSQRHRRTKPGDKKPLSRSASSTRTPHSFAQSYSTLSMPLSQSITQCRSEGRLNKQLCYRWFGSVPMEKGKSIFNNTI